MERGKIDTSIFISEEKKSLPPIVELKNLRQIFNEGKPNEYRLFDDFNLTIEDTPNKSELISIVGGSGCGKSQILKVIAGLSKVQSGEVKIFGKPRIEVGSIPMVFQTYSNYEWMTVLENVMLPMVIKGIPKIEAKEKAVEFIKQVGLEDHIDKYAKNSILSGGQLQRVSIARSLACESKIILLDEATGALDIKMKREVQGIIQKIGYTAERTIINVTHSVEEAVFLSTKIIILLPKPCRIYKVIDIDFGEGPRERGILGTDKFNEYSGELTRALEEVCI